MSRDYLFFYSEATVVCILFFVIMLVNDHRNGNRQEKQILLDRVMVAHIVYFANDWVWAALLSGLIPRTRVVKQKTAPMGDPIQIRVRGYELTLRLEDAAKIELREVETP